MTIYTLQTYPPHLREFVTAVKGALERGVADALNAVNMAAQDNLSGDKAAPWSYPVPNRTSNLYTLQRAESQTPLSGYVFNTADYAHAIHGGHVSEWAGRDKHRTVQRLARPFIDDAVTSAQPLMVIQKAFQGALSAWA